ncbi:MAG: hypothetical protein VB031_01060 [Eubacteriaceae bacterium]|nr:hypothetical protein [Eubacteriaceae bacterium]
MEYKIQYRLNGFLWFGLGMVIDAVAGLFMLLDLGYSYYFTFIGVSGAALIAEIIGVSLVGSYGRGFIWGRGFVITAAILKGLSYPLGIRGIMTGSTALMVFALAIDFASVIILMLGIYNYMNGAGALAEKNRDEKTGKRMTYAKKLYMGLVVCALVLGSFFASGRSTISGGIGMAAQMLLIIGAALVSLRLIQLAADYSGKEIK